MRLSSNPVMEAGVETAGPGAVVVRNWQILQLHPEGGKTACILGGGGRVLVSNILGTHIRLGDEIRFPLALDSSGAGTEIYIRTTSPTAWSPDIYLAPIS